MRPRWLKSRTTATTRTAKTAAILASLSAVICKCQLAFLFCWTFASLSGCNLHLYFAVVVVTPASTSSPEG
jgi:hypothetical protein